MTEISLNILDIANNSIKAGADFIEISLHIHKDEDKLTVTITDNGCGMTKEQLLKAEDPFYTTRTTRNVGLGIPFFKQAALCTGGRFFIASEPGKGTKITATFRLSHIDCLPLGDINSTIYTLIIANNRIDFLYTYESGGRYFKLDTRQFRRLLHGIPLTSPEVRTFLKEYLDENHREVDLV